MDSRHETSQEMSGCCEAGHRVDFLQKKQGCLSHAPCVSVKHLLHWALVFCSVFVLLVVALESQDLTSTCGGQTDRQMGSQNRFMRFAKSVHKLWTLVQKDSKQIGP